MQADLALVRRPSRRFAEGILTHLAREPVNYQLAVQQWEGYCEAFRSAGWQLREVPAADGCPDSAFVEDTMVIFRNVAVISRPAAGSRQPEIDQAGELVQQLGYSINRIREPGTLEGGDVLKIGDTVYVGRSDRTNAAGIAQLREILAPIGANVIAVPVHRVLHLKSAVTALPDGTVIGCLPVVEDPLLFDRFRPVPETSGGQVVLLGGNRLLIAASCPATADLLSDLGYQPIPVDISEFEKLEGSVTCLSVRLRGCPAGLG